MAIALVGSQGAIRTGTTSVTPVFGQTTTANNLLIIQFSSDGGLLSPPGDWNSRGTTTGFLSKRAVGNDTAPTLSFGSGTLSVVMASEFSGIDTTFNTEDTSGSSSSLTSPHTTSGSSITSTVNSLYIGQSMCFYSMAATKTTSRTFNNSVSVLGNQNNDATSTVTHYRFGYGIASSNASAPTTTLTFTTTNITLAESVIGAFKESAAVTVDPIEKRYVSLPFMPRGRNM